MGNHGTANILKAYQLFLMASTWIVFIKLCKKIPVSALERMIFQKWMIVFRKRFCTLSMGIIWKYYLLKEKLMSNT